MAQFVGEPISKDVVDQLKAREELLGNPSGLRESSHLRFLNSRNSWVRMISGVDVLDTDQGAVYTNEKAKGFILGSGEFKWDSKFLNNQGFKPTTDPVERGTYNYNESLGVRPQSGITSFSINHKNRFGTIREADISFTVWTREDLGLAQDLYLRPGMSVIVEWGNSVYVTNDGSVEDMTNPPEIDKFFTAQNRQEIISILNNHKNSTDYNYDAFIGLVSNFVWSLRGDGGYDCNVKVISIGTVLQSLTALRPLESLSETFNISILKDLTVFQNTLVRKNSISSDTLNPGSYTEEEMQTAILENRTPSDKEKELQIRSSFLGLLNYFIEQYNFANNALTPPDKTAGTGATIEERTGKADPRIFYDDLNVVVKNVESTASGLKELKTVNSSISVNLPLVEELKKELFIAQTTGGLNQQDFIGPIPNPEDVNKDGAFLGVGFESSGDTPYFAYVSLRTLMAIFNLSFNATAPNGNSYTAFYVPPSVDEQTYSTLPKYLTFKNHFSFNPYVCILPKRVSQEELKDSVEIKPLRPYIFPEKSTPHRYYVTRTLEANTPTQDKDCVYEIFVNLPYVLEKYNNYLSSTSEESDSFQINAYDFIKSILKGINASLGGINELDLQYDEDLEKFLIVDRMLMTNKVIASPKRVPIISATGLSSTIQELKIQTKISSQLSSQIAISANASNLGNNNLSAGIVDWNLNVKDRFFAKKENNNDGLSIEQILQQQSEFRSKGLDVKDYLGEADLKKLNDYNQSEKVKEEEREQFLEAVKNSYTTFNAKTGWIFNQPTYREVVFNKIKSQGFSRTRRILIQSGLENGSSVGLLPIELNMRLDGISGLKIAQAFTLGTPEQPSTILPDIYNRYGFIVTGLDSTIEGNKWSTSVRGLTFKLYTNKENSKGEFQIIGKY